MSLRAEPFPSAVIPLTGHLPDAEASTAFARAIAPLCGPGDTILLHGDLGTGKTHFARALIQHHLAAAQRLEDVPSPSFTLVQVYDLPGFEIWHADLYRLTGPDEVFELGLDEAFETALCLVEWPERLGPDAAPHAAHLFLTHAENGGRDFRLVLPQTGFGERIIAALRKAGIVPGSADA